MSALAIVTGAGSGIGEALSARLVERGDTVLAIGRRPAPLQALAERHRGRVETLALDVGAEDAPQRVLAALGGRAPARVVHNAGVLAPAGPLTEVERADFTAHLQTNLLAPLFLTQALLPVLAPGARILHISSGAAHHPLAGWGPYCVSKSALHMLYQCWREELRERGILVGSARPGVVDTPMQAQIRKLAEADFPDVEAFRQLKANGQLATPDTVARFLCWLLFDADAARFSERENDIRDAALAPLWQNA
ncbi:SDR family NAD(P)-dependent oxidoreductase [Pseudothauera nasutitermitis]|uniref:SDR family NAD(P)-dependent oxidoreductase n=1 Tax=Pseudothauera nasutitermitis TaxID=2565930 RepID=A0A4S4AX43_9RHOO|nr:SDR family NAD(P)-dependent oxidoreductase [Pseudothauera nasutitermitis]